MKTEASKQVESINLIQVFFTSQTCVNRGLPPFLRKKDIMTSKRLVCVAAVEPHISVFSALLQMLSLFYHFCFS